MHDMKLFAVGSFFFGAILAFMLAGPGVAAVANPGDGNKLSAACESSLAADQGWCIGYIEGALHTFLMTGSLTNQTICVSEGVNVGQMEDTVRLWLLQHPEKRHWPAPKIVFEVLKEKFPCN
jgi:hypothetical protein